LPRGAFAARALANNTIIKAGVCERCKVLTKSQSEHFTFSDAIFTGECSVEIERYPRQSFRKVGEQHCNKGQPTHRCFVLFSLHGETFQSQSNSTRPSISLFGHNLGLL